MQFAIRLLQGLNLRTEVVFCEVHDELGDTK